MTTSKKADSKGASQPASAATLETKVPVHEDARIIAVLVPNLGSPHHVMVFRGLDEILGAQGLGTMFHNVGPEDQADPATLSSLQMHRPGGYIVIQGGEGRDAEHARTILQNGVPLVSVGKLEGVETHGVAVDDRLVTRMTTDYVIARGHRRLGYLAGPAHFGCAKQRQVGFMESLTHHDIRLSDVLISETGTDPQQGYLTALEMLKDPKTRPTALVCFNDMLAVEAYRAARALSLDIPNDVSIVGVDNVDCAAQLNPPLTTVDIFAEECGRLAATMLVKAIRKEIDKEIDFQWIEPKLVERGSVRSI